MDNYEKVEAIVAKKYNCPTTGRLAIGDFMIDEDFAVDVKSHDLDKTRIWLANIVAANKAYEWLSAGNDLAYIFVEYRSIDGNIEIEKETAPIMMEHIKWDCLKINNQGLGVIQLVKELQVDENQTKEDWFKGLGTAYKDYISRQRVKLDSLEDKFCTAC